MVGISCHSSMGDGLHVPPSDQCPLFGHTLPHPICRCAWNPAVLRVALFTVLGKEALCLVTLMPLGICTYSTP